MRGWICAASAALMVFAGLAHAKFIPPIVQSDIDGLIAECKADKEKPKFNKGFLTRKDINADGVEDFVLDYGAFSCGGMASIYCGSAGCVTVVFASLPGGSFVKAFDGNVQALSFVTVAGKPAIRLGLHGSSCGKVGAAECAATLVWNGKTFAEGR